MKHFEIDIAIILEEVVDELFLICCKLFRDVV